MGRFMYLDFYLIGKAFILTLSIRLIFFLLNLWFQVFNRVIYLKNLNKGKCVEKTRPFLNNNGYDA